MGPPAADSPPALAAAPAPAAGPRWPAARAAVAALCLVGWSARQLRRLADLRVRARRGALAADGYAGLGAPAPRPRPAP